MMPPYYQVKKSGFTLIELSIVLVIIGLIAGGILVGKDLITASKLRKVVSDVERFNTARNTFRLKYNAIAGDMGNATQFFGAKISCDGVSNIDVYNGNGDGILWANNYGVEALYFWQHLALSGLLENCYADGGSPTTNGLDHNGAIANPYGVKSIPTSPFGGTTGYSVVTPNGTNMGGNGIYGKYGVFIWLGSEETIGSSAYHLGAALSAVDAYSIDGKIDDGIARSGKILTGASPNSVANTCVTPSIAFHPHVWQAPAAYATTDYVRTNTEANCSMVFQIE